MKWDDTLIVFFEEEHYPYKKVVQYMKPLEDLASIQIEQAQDWEASSVQLTFNEFTEPFTVFESEDYQEVKAFADRLIAAIRNKERRVIDIEDIKKG